MRDRQPDVAPLRVKHIGREEEEEALAHPDARARERQEGLPKVPRQSEDERKSALSLNAASAVTCELRHRPRQR